MFAFEVAFHLVTLCGTEVLAGVTGARGRVPGIPLAADILRNNRRAEAALHASAQQGAPAAALAPVRRVRAAAGAVDALS
jgi:hypothetical protein